MKKHTKVAFSLLLVVCMLISGMPIATPAIAVGTDNQASELITETLPGEAVAADTAVLNEDAVIVEEDTALRGEYEKHFFMSDGSYQVALYNEPVHKMEGGEWVEIDNTLTLKTATDGTARYATTDGLTDVSFSQSFDDQLITMQQDDYFVSWGVQAFSSSLSTNTSAELVKPIQAELVTSEQSTFSVEEQKTLATKSSSTIQYRNALRQNVDLEYVVLPSRVKENIILQSAQDISYYAVTVYTENLCARLLENREIEFYNSSDEAIFTMTSPYMYDNAGELSEDITVEMVSKGDGCYFIKMTPNAQWLSSESRVYPVVIDPQVSVDTARSNIIDNYVLKDAGVQNRNLDRLYIGNRPEGLTRAFIQYVTMPTLPENSIITAATMTLTFTNGTDTAETAAASMVTGGEWASGTIKWANMPEANTLLARNIGHNDLTGYTFSCLTAVRAWYNGDTTGQNANYGIMLRYNDETAADYNAVYSADYTDESKRPTLVIYYDNIVSGGIYRIKSHLTGFSIGANGSIANNTTVVTTAYSTSSPEDMLQLWRITVLGDGLYSVRPVFAPDMALSLSPSGICIQKIGTNDSLENVPSSALWKIVTNGVSYGFLNNSDSASAMTLTGATFYPGANITTGAYSPDSVFCQWNLVKVENPIAYGAWIFDTSNKAFSTWPEKKIVYGETKTLSSLKLIPTIFTATDVVREFYWESSNSGIVSVNENTGTVTGVSGGRAVITGTASVGSTEYSVNITIHSTLPTSGYELEYNSAQWSGLVEDNCNCYAYAINNQINPDTNNLWFKQQPGEYSGTRINGYLLNPDKIVQAVQADYEKYNTEYGTSYSFSPIGRFEVCPAGTYKVALVITDINAERSDYHWYRQDADGFWSHKPGTTPVIRTDSSGRRIADPSTADRGNYTIFVGYYAVTPWNNLYSAAETSNLSVSSIADDGETLDLFADTEKLELIQIGMTLDEVHDILEVNGIDIGYGTIIHEYQTHSGLVTVSYCIDANGIYRVAQIIGREAE